MLPLSALQGPAFEALKILVRAGGDSADIFIEQNRSSRVKIEASRADQLTQGGEFGAGLRLLRGRSTLFASTNDVTPEGLKTAAQDLVNAAHAGGRELPAIKAAAARNRPAVQPPSEVPFADQIKLAMAAEAAARGAGSHIRQVTVFLGASEQQVAIARSDGAWCEDARTQVVLWANAVARQEDLIQTGYESAGGSVGWEFFHTLQPEAVGLAAGRRAEKMLSARPAPSGRMTVVLAAEAGGTMIHEAIGHSLEADLVQKKLSPFADKVGQAVASPLITVVDDATLAGWRGSFGYDDEGTPAQRTVLVDRGQLLGFMHDTLSARHGQAAPTGNGRRQSYEFRPIPRMTNTMILPGTDDPQAILRSVDNGLYVVRMGGGQVNTVNGDFIFEVNEGYFIRKGELAEAVRGASLIGNGQQVLMSIDRVGRDQGRGIGTCGKDGQGVPVADAQPTIRIPEITIGGVE